MTLTEHNYRVARILAEGRAYYDIACEALGAEEVKRKVGIQLSSMTRPRDYLIVSFKDGGYKVLKEVKCTPKIEVEIIAKEYIQEHHPVGLVEIFAPLSLAWA